MRSCFHAALPTSLLVAFALSLAPACGDSGVGGDSGAGADVDDTTDVHGSTDEPGDEPGDETDGPETGDTPVPDTPEPGDEPGDETDELPPEDGETGAACETGDDCYSGWCLPSQDGLVCSKGCLSSCPNGWLCRSITGASGQPAFVCIDPLAFLCVPCLDTVTCNQLAAGAGNVCVQNGNNGSFCGVACDETTPCPEGFACEAVPAPGGGTADQCVPVDGQVCACTQLASDLGATTSCNVTNEHGSCPGARYCADDGLTACDGFEPDAESCNGVDDDCDGTTDEGTGGGLCEVATPDGTCPGTSVCQGGKLVCEGAEPKPEVCNGLDDDCDGITDDGELDSDGDGIADCVDPDDDNDGSPDLVDCAPYDEDVNPEAVEKCDDDKDNDCDGQTDEADALGCSTFWLDADGDGYGSEGDPTTCLCEADPTLLYTGTIPGDCDDLDAAVHLGGDEVCDGVDGDCDGETDEGFPDIDGDGLAGCVDPDDDDDGFLDAEDCAPTVASVNPAATESCNGVDDDCDGVTDENASVGCSWYLQDADFDGQGSTDVPGLCQCGPNEETLFTAKFGGDCDDLDDGVFDGAVESCNGKDDDCDGETDEGSPDTDADGLANCVDPDDDQDGVLDEADCAPLDPSVHTAVNELCNGKDDDCDGETDEEDALGCEVYYRDLDGDQVGSDAHEPRCLCAAEPATWYTADAAGDCDDANPNQAPGKPELCNDEDDDCDEAVDEGVLSPCGDCSAFCVVRVGPDGDEPFAPTALNALKTTLDGGGDLTLTQSPGSGFYRHVIEGWTAGQQTDWQMLIVEGDLQPGVTWLTVRYRTAGSKGALTTAPWQGPFGSFPPEAFPLDVDQTADFLEVELTLHSNDAAVNVTVHELSIVAAGI